MEGIISAAKIVCVGQQAWAVVTVTYPNEAPQSVRLRHPLDRNIALNECLYLDDFVGVTWKRAQQVWDDIVRNLSADC